MFHGNIHSAAGACVDDSQVAPAASMNPAAKLEALGKVSGAKPLVELPHARCGG